MAVLEANEVQKQGTELMKMVTDEDRFMSANTNKTLYDVLPECPVPCVTGVDDKGKAVFSQVDLHDTVNEYSSFSRDIQDYLSAMKHTEELGAVKDDTIMFCPEAVAKEDNMLNIDFDLEGTNREAAGEFNMLVLEALGRRGYNVYSERQDRTPDQRRQLLRDHLELGRKVKALQNKLFRSSLCIAYC